MPENGCIFLQGGIADFQAKGPFAYTAQPPWGSVDWDQDIETRPFIPNQRVPEDRLPGGNCYQVAAIEDDEGSIACAREVIGGRDV